MKRHLLISICALIAASAGFAAPAMATPSETFTLDTWQGSGSETGPFGTVSLTVVSAGIQVDVSLDSGMGFTNTGAGDSLDFYLANSSGPISSITIDSLTAGFSGNTSAGSYSASSDKGFNYAIVCGTACGSGGSNVYTGSIDFTVENVTLDDFQPTSGKSGGHYFASDICDGTSGTDPVTCANGNTGPVTAERDARIVPVPEPVTLSLFGAGLAGAVAMRRRKKA